MKRFLIAFGAACILALSITGIVYIIHVQRRLAVVHQLMATGPANLMREEAIDRQAGMIIRPEQMQASLPPASQNAAPLYTKLTLLLKQKPIHLPKYAEGMDTFHIYTPAQVTLVRQTLARRTDIMELVHQASDRPKCVFVRNWSLGADVQFPEYQPMREAVRLLKTESYLLARDGHYQEAITDQSRGFRIAEHASSDPVLLPYLVGLACDTITLSGMQSIMEIAGPNNSVDAEVENVITARQPRLSLRYALAGEAGFGSTCMINMHKGEDQGMLAANAAGGFPQDADQTIPAHILEGKDLHHLIDAWQYDYLAHMRVLVTACDLPPRQRKAVFAAADKQLDHEGQDVSNPTHIMTIILMPVATKIAQNPIRIRARRTVTQAAASVLSAKAKTGICPNALPSQYSDPFTGRPLEYRREGRNGFVIYSAGPTGTFDGGKPSEKVPAQESVFRYPAVPIPLTADMLK